MSHNKIPLVDFKQCLLRTEKFLEEDLNEVGKELTKAFSEVGFAYLKNTGFSREILENAKLASMEFFLRSYDEKMKYARNPVTNNGYIGFAVESVNPERPGDLKEAFNISGLWCHMTDAGWPDDLAPDFSTAFKPFLKDAKKLGNIVLRALSVGMGLKDEHFFEKCHKLQHEEGNMSIARTLYYPAVEDSIKAGQIRLGEHTDYGSLTLLFQDEIGGLQVQNSSGQFVDATPIEDTIVTNIGDTLQFWTKGKLKSTKHRILIPEKRNKTRQSMAYFIHADDDVRLDEPLIYKDPALNVQRDIDRPVCSKGLTSREYLFQKLHATY